MKNFIVKTLPFSILLITISSVNAWTQYEIGNTYFWWVVYLFIIYLLIKGRRSVGMNLSDNPWPISFFLYIVIASFFYSFFKAEYYWDWKLLFTNLMIFSLPLAIYVFCSPILLKLTLRIWLKYALWVFPVFLFILHSEAYGRYLVPIGFLLLFYPKLPFRWKFLCLFVVLLIVSTSADARSNVIKFIIPLFIGSLLYLRRFFAESFRAKIFLIVLVVLWFSPFVFFGLAATNSFNVFNMSDYLSSWQKDAEMNREGNDFSLLDDTRTFIYEEEIQSAIQNEYWIWGRSMARGYDTKWFAGADVYKDVQKDTKRNERQSCEVSILNIFNYFGLLGVVSYFLIFITASYKAVVRSNNIYMNIVGIYIAFRWVFAWVEDFSRFDLNCLFLWILIGMCYSKPFKCMSNTEFDIWLKSLFYVTKNRRPVTLLN